MDEPTCRCTVACLADYLDEELGPRERDRFEGHLGGCDRCLTYAAQYMGTVRCARRAGC